MFTILHMLLILVADIFKSRRRLQAENLFLRHQLNVALRRAPPRLRSCSARLSNANVNGTSHLRGGNNVASLLEFGEGVAKFQDGADVIEAFE